MLLRKAHGAKIGRVVVTYGVRNQLMKSYKPLFTWPCEAMCYTSIEKKLLLLLLCCII